MHETGPIAKNFLVAPILNAKPKDDTLKIKIELTKGLWRLDYVGVTPVNSPATPNSIYPSNIEVISGEKYTLDEIRHDDDRYLVSFPGDEFRFTFELPEIDEESEYELFLSSKGYYLEWIRKQWIEGKNLPKLRKMLLNDKRTWIELAAEYKAIEKDMENTFWNSKYSKIQ